MTTIPTQVPPSLSVDQQGVFHCSCDSKALLFNVLTHRDKNIIRLFIRCRKCTSLFLIDAKELANDKEQPIIEIAK